MKILLIIQKPQYRGAEVFARKLAGALRPRGHEARIVCLYPHGGPTTLPLESGDEVLGGREDHPLERWMGFHPSLLTAVAGSIRRFRPDIVQVHGGRTVKYGALTTYLAPRRRWILVYRNIGDPRVWLSSWLRRLWYRRIVAPRLDGVVGVSRHTLAGVREIYGLRVPAVVIPGAVDPEDLQPTRSASDVRRDLGTPPEAPVVISVGSLSPEKRPERIVNAVARLRSPSPVYLWMAGEGPLRRTLEVQAQEIGIADRIRFLGVREDVGDLLRAADLFVLTSDTEGVPGVLLEAGYVGLPAVATRVGGVPECVIHEKTGFLVEPGDEEALVRRLDELIRSPERRRSLGRRAAGHVRRHFLLDAVTERYTDFYHQLRDGAT